MIGPYKTLVWMTLFLLATAIALAFVRQPVSAAFQSSPWFNGLILFVLGVGIVRNYLQVGGLYREIRWIEAFRSDSHSVVPEHTTPLLAPMARMLSRKDGDRLTLSPVTTRSILDSIGDRIAESRDVSRYLIGLLIFLGLLGTFWGLLATISSVAGVIDRMTVDTGDPAVAFASLTDGLRQPLSGMAIAFSSSLFGLAGSLVLGFLDLQASRAHQRFFNGLEEWLSGITRLSSGAGLGDVEAPVPVYIEALLEKTADSIDRLQRIVESQATDRSDADFQLLALTREISLLSQQLKRSQNQPIPDDLRQELRLLTRTIGAALGKK